jgi:signal transduction histidine kinase
MTPDQRTRPARMMAVLGHELRNPLAAAIAGISAAAEMTVAADPRHAFLRQALQDLGRVSALLDHYLDFGCSGAVRGTELELGDLLARLQGRYPQCVAVHARGEATVRGDGVLLERVLENLVDNALQAGAARIDLSLSVQDGKAVIEVRDDGPGIPEHLRKRVFDPFVSGGTGSGLGLAVVADVLASHGGDIAVLPNDPGARFRIELPLWRCRARAAVAATATATALS